MFLMCKMHICRINSYNTITESKSMYIFNFDRFSQIALQSHLIFRSFIYSAKHLLRPTWV